MKLLKFYHFLFIDNLFIDTFLFIDKVGTQGVYKKRNYFFYNLLLHAGVYHLCASACSIFVKEMLLLNLIPEFHFKVLVNPNFA